MIAAISRLTRAAIGSGTPVGAASTNQPAKSKPGKVSATAGTSGKSGSRFAEVTASARSLPLATWPRAVGDGDDEELHAAGEHILHALRHLRVRHVGNLRAGELVEPGRDHAGEAPRAVGGDRELVRVGLGVGEQLRQVLRRHVRIRQHHEGTSAMSRRYGEVLHRVVGQRLERVGIGHQRRARSRRRTCSRRAPSVPPPACR